jgi:hypothetical protein
VGEHLLDVLAANGIAAYLQPASDLNPVTRTTTMPARPTDRLYVDRAHLATARDYLARLAAEEEGAGHRRTPDIDAEWARIVAGFHTEVDPGTRPWPAVENLPSPTGPTSPPTAPDAPAPDATHEPAGDGTTGLLGPPGTRGPDPGRIEPGRIEPGRIEPGGTAAPSEWAPGRSGDRPIERRRRPTAGTPDEPSLLDALDTFGADLPDDPSDDEGYTPPPPPPLPHISKYAVAGVLGVVVGFVLFLFPHLVPLDADVVMLFGFTCILAGFVTLVWRLRPGDEEDAEDDPDDGAVV